MWGINTMKLHVTWPLEMTIHLAISTKAEHVLTLPPSNSTLMYMPNKNVYIYHPKNMQKNVQAALFIITSSWKLPKCLSTIDWISKMWLQSYYRMPHSH